MDRRELEQAVAISDSMATRELASKIATAFDCVEYVKKQKVILVLVSSTYDVHGVGTF